jgi:hypothetical protein
MNKKICPKCGGTDVRLGPEPWQSRSVMALQNYKCSNCDYEGPMAEKGDKE